MCQDQKNARIVLVENARNERSEDGKQARQGMGETEKERERERESACSARQPLEITAKKGDNTYGARV